jgi:hypothetical protein
LRKDVKSTKKMLAEIDDSIKTFEEAKAKSPSNWTAAEDGVLTLLRCFKFVFEHNL